MIKGWIGSELFLQCWAAQFTYVPKFTIGIMVNLDFTQHTFPTRSVSFSSVLF